MTDISTLSLEEQCNMIWAATTAREEAEARSRLEPPKVRIWTGDWDLAGVLNTEYTAEFTWIDNDAGTGLTEIPLWDPIAKWIWQVKDRVDAGERRNVFITVDKDGARWSGVLFDHTIEKREDGTRVLVVRWMHDFFFLSHYLVWCNPFLPDFVQFPRTFFLAGPSIWTLKTALFLNIMREQTSLWELPDDPMNQGSSAPGMGNWSVVVKPTEFLDDMNAGTLWSVPNSRFKYWTEMSKDILADAELSVICRRFLTDDDEQPIAGQTLRNGCLVIDIVDKSGYYSDTSNGGDPFLGLKRTVAKFTDDFLDDFQDAIVDPAVPGSYGVPGQKLTDKTCPYVVYMEGEETGIESSKFTYTPSTAIQIVTGGHSMPFVNELISACVSGDTIVDGPDGALRIDALAAHGEPFRVWSLTPSGDCVPATATRAFLKGRAELFEYVLESGRSIKATHKHRFLSPSGWIRGVDVQVGSAVAAANHSTYSRAEVQLPTSDLDDSSYRAVPESIYATYEVVVEIRPLGVDDYYDMSVPGWQNYSANGFWNHNTIQTAGDLIAMMIGVPPVGGATDAVLQPFYWDTIAAWNHAKSQARATHSGWARLYEYIASSGDRAYTLEALLSIRKGLHDTRSWFSHEVMIRDGAPWYIGDQGKGHFFIGDRIGAQVLGDFAATQGFDDFTIYVDQVTELTLAWDRDSFAEWKCTIGEKEKNKDRGARTLSLISDLYSTVRTLGVTGK
ncbi:hypothetical protein [Nocardia sp. NPDC004860]|uniref:Gp37-like protein n=1 Tax=Nocardia sp. NPDC004860 TaxID=3154557 RepID=UPI0033A74413